MSGGRSTLVTRHDMHVEMKNGLPGDGAVELQQFDAIRIESRFDPARNMLH